MLPLEVTVHDVKASLDAGEDFVLLDCREAEEFAIARIEGSQLLPMSELMVRVGELEAARDRRIVVHCHHGGRSLQVTQWLRGRGFANVQNMAGGIDQWALEIDATLPRY